MSDSHQSESHQPESHPSEAHPSGSPLTDDLRRLLARPNPCVMATLRKDGSPVTVPTWYRLVADRIHLNLDAGRVRLQHLRRDPRVALSVLDADDWYSHVSIQGRITEIAEDPDLAVSTRCPGTTRTSRTRSAIAPASTSGWRSSGYTRGGPRRDPDPAAGDAA